MPTAGTARAASRSSPRCRSARATASPRSSCVHRPGPRCRVGAPMRILVIEDEPRILDFLRQGLEAEGFVVEAAEDGVSGLRHALSGAYELVVLDLLLPGIDGLEMLTELRRAGSGVPVLILSARSDLPTRLR